MTALLRDLFTDNPMLSEGTRVGRRFLRSGGDSGKAVNFVVLGVLAFFYLWLLLAIVRMQENVVVSLLIFELVVVTLVVPASIYGAIAGERERATWEALILTRLTPAQIIAGKLFWRVVIVLAILFLLGIPLVLNYFTGVRAISSLTTSASAPALLRGQTIVLFWGVFLCAWGLWVSALARRSVSAIAVIAGSLLFALLLLPLLLAIFDVRLDSVRADRPLDYVGGFLVALNPFFVLGEIEGARGSEQNLFLLPEMAFLPLGAYALGTAFFLLATHRGLRKLEEPDRRGG